MSNINKVSANSVQMLNAQDSGLENLLVRVSNVHINNAFCRRDPVIITNTDNGKQIIRYAVGESPELRLGWGKIAIDYDGMITLGLKYSTEPQRCELTIRKATTYEKYRFFMNHPNLDTQLSIRLGLLGAGLGVVGLFLGVISLVVTFVPML